MNQLRALFTKSTSPIAAAWMVAAALAVVVGMACAGGDEDAASQTNADQPDDSAVVVADTDGDDTHGEAVADHNHDEGAEEDGHDDAAADSGHDEDAEEHGHDDGAADAHADDGHDDGAADAHADDGHADAEHDAGSEPDATVTVHASDLLKYDPAEIHVEAGQRVRLVLDNEEGSALHDLSVEEMPVADVHAEGADHAHDEAAHYAMHVATEPGESSVVEFTPTEPGTYEFFCTVPGHRENGMVGTFIVE